MLQYLIKFSISLAVLYIFYRAVLRPLTFYQWNRFYLLGYSALSFLIPFIDISNWMGEAGAEDNRYISIIPSVSRYTVIAPRQSSFFQQLTFTNWILMIFLTGALLMLVRVLLQYVSLHRLRAKSRLLTGNGRVQLYETSEAITPFSFGNAIYINPDRHTEEELQRIIQHEFVHVRQKHSIDLLTGELLCIINWFNPFAWLIRHAVRQNLEFIADRQVLQNGIAKKEYQYLLLKVIGAPQYALASHFNFSNLKKRITMMNKMKSAKLHLTKFLFVLPLLAVLLLSFRSYNSDNHKTVVLAGLLVDAAGMQPIANATIQCSVGNITVVTDEKGFYSMEIPYENKPLQFTLLLSKPGYMSLQQAENWGNFYHEAVRSKYRFSIELFGLSKTGQGFSRLAGNTRSREELNYSYALSQLHLLGAAMEEDTKRAVDTLPAPPPPPPPAMVNKKGYLLTVADNNGECVVLVKDQQRKIVKAVTLEEWNKNKKENETRYGVIPPPPPPPPAPTEINIYPAPEAPVKNNAEFIPAPAAPVKKGGVEIRPAAPLRAGQVPPVAPAIGTVKLNAVNALYPPLYIVDGKEMLPGYDLNTLNPDDIQSISVWKDEKATSKYGEKAKYGVIDIVTKNKADLPDGLLIVLDGKQLPAGSRIEDHVKPEAIESMNVLKGKTAAAKYGEKGDAGVIEVNTKNNRDYFPSDVLVLIDGKEIPAGSKIAEYVNQQNIESMTVLKDKTAYIKYGEKAKKGAIEIKTKRPPVVN